MFSVFSLKQFEPRPTKAAAFAPKLVKGDMFRAKPLLPLAVTLSPRAAVFALLAPTLLVVVAPACGGRSGPRAQAAAKQGPDDLDRAIDALAEQIVAKLTSEQKTKVAVNEFLTLKGETNDLGKFLSEELSTRVINSGKTQVVERRLLQKVLSEQEMGASQLVDDETAARVGKLVGADTLCTGTLTDLGAEIKVNARLINAETAEVYGAASVDLPKNRAVLALIGGGGFRPAIAVGPAPTTPSKGNTQASASPEPARPFVTQAPAQSTAAQTQQQTQPSTPAPARPQPQQTPAYAPAEPAVYLGKPGGDFPDLVWVHNKTKYCLKIWLNGKVLKVYDRSMEIPCVPDRERSYVRLGSFGQYRVQASGSVQPNPFKGIVAYDQKFSFTPDQKKLVVVLKQDDFYAVP